VGKYVFPDGRTDCALSAVPKTANFEKFSVFFANFSVFFANFSGFLLIFQVFC